MKTKLNGFLYNPLLYYGIGLVPAILVCTSLKTAVIFGALVFFGLILSNMLVSFFKFIIPRSIRIPCFMLISFASVYIVDALIYLLFLAEYSSLSPLIAIIIISTVLLFRAEEGVFKNNKFSAAVWDGFSHGLSYFIAVAFVGLLREFLSFGSIWEQSTSWAGISSGFDTMVGGLFITIIIAFAYNLITIPIRKKQLIFDSLVERYTAYLKKTMYSDDNVIDDNYRKET